MKINTNTNRLFGLGLSVMLTGMAAEALAGSTFTITEFKAEGNVNCNDYALNSLVNSLSTSKPVLTGGTLVSGSQEVDYYFSDEGDEPDPTTLNFAIKGASENIDYAVLKNATGKEVTVLIYLSGGIKLDTNMRLPSQGNIGAISLCYGLGNETLSPPEIPVDVPRCEEVTNLDGTGIDCSGVPSDQRRVISSLNLDAADGGFAFCTCNVAEGEAQECDPGLTVDDFNFSSDGCLSGEPNNAMPSETQLINDGTTYCYNDPNGRRRCIKF